MSRKETQYGVLVGADGSAQSEAAIRWAAVEAARHDLPLTLLHAVAPVVVSWPVGPMQATIAEWQEDNAGRVIEHARKTVESAAGNAKLNVRAEVVYSAIVPALVDASSEARMVVVGSRGAGTFGRALLGSVSSGVLHHAHCPVAVIPSDNAAPDPHAPVVVGIDGSPSSEAATALAFDEAARRNVDLVALHAWCDAGIASILGADWPARERGEELLTECLAGWQERFPDVKVHRRLVDDQPAQRLVDLSRNAQLVVVGSHGRGGFARMLLGSVSSKVAQESSVPVMVVRSGEESASS